MQLQRNCVVNNVNSDYTTIVMMRGKRRTINPIFRCLIRRIGRPYRVLREGMTISFFLRLFRLPATGPWPWAAS
jgi:hypothetical protein